MCDTVEPIYAKLQHISNSLDTYFKIPRQSILLLYARIKLPSTSIFNI